MTKDTNTGYCNTGDYNTGHYNTGYYNTGHRNTGCYNTGHRNTGYYNTASYHVGCFNTVDAPKAYFFNKLIDVAVWEAARKPACLRALSPLTWVVTADMTDKEKAAHPEHETTGGYLRVNDMKEEWRKAYEGASQEDRELVKQLPGFDADVFLEITGIDVREQPKASCDGREIEIDGVTYVLTEKK